MFWHMFSLSLQQQNAITMALSLLNKYVWLVDTIYRHKYISFEKINELWLNDERS